MLGRFAFAALAAALSALSGAPAVSAAITPAPIQETYDLNPNDPAADMACAARGGNAETRGTGRVCVLPPNCKSNQTGVLMATEPLSSTDSDASKKCTNACGMVTSSAQGQLFCTKPAMKAGGRTMGPRPGGSGAPREPTH